MTGGASRSVTLPLAAAHLSLVEVAPAFQPADRNELQEAVYAWHSDKDAAVAAYGPIGAWDVSRVSDMSYLFDWSSNFNEDLSGWDTSHITSMYGMFNGCGSFTSDLSRWDVSNVVDLGYMFYGASSFTSDLSGWHTSACTDMQYMFEGASSFNSDLN